MGSFTVIAVCYTPSINSVITISQSLSWDCHFMETLNVIVENIRPDVVNPNLLETALTN